MKTRLIINCSKPEQKAGAEALEEFCNDWAEEYRTVQAKRARVYKERTALRESFQRSKNGRTGEEQATSEAKRKP